MSDRRGLGLDIAKSHSINENEDGSFSVPSQSDRNKFYVVRLFGHEWTCDCPDFVNRVGQIDACKHIHAVKFWIAARVELEQKPKPKVFADDAIQCAKCGSIRVVKNGIKRQKQAYVCRDCGHKFTEKAMLRGSRYTPEMVSLTLDLYFSGMSLRKIARTMNSHYGLSLGNATIYRWIQRFVPMISEYVNSKTPELSDTWHMDEVFVKARGGTKVFTHGKDERKGEMTIGYLWNVMDRKTRFLLASELTKARDVGGADRAIREAKKNAHGSEPEKVFTDSLSAYNDAVRFGLRNSQHIAKAGIGKPHASNNRIERLNGTVRERVKVQRGWKTLRTPLAEGQRIHYNFVKPHQALAGQTPAERAGVGVWGQNKWLELLTNAIKEGRTSQNGN